MSRIIKISNGEGFFQHPLYPYPSTFDNTLISRADDRYIHFWIQGLFGYKVWQDSASFKMVLELFMASLVQDSIDFKEVTLTLC